MHLSSGLVGWELELPSSGGIEALYYLFAPKSPGGSYFYHLVYALSPYQQPPTSSPSSPAVKEIRLVRDKYTGSPRGFAFVHFYTVADAAKALNALQVGDCKWAAALPLFISLLCTSPCGMLHHILHISAVCCCASGVRGLAS